MDGAWGVPCGGPCQRRMLQRHSEQRLSEAIVRQRSRGRCIAVEQAAEQANKNRGRVGHTGQTRRRAGGTGGEAGWGGRGRPGPRCP